jgi:hypothetical protein
MSEDHFPNSHILHSMVFKLWDNSPLMKEKIVSDLFFL